MSTTKNHFFANESRFPKFRVIGEKYVRCGSVGVAGNDFGDHVDLHFADGDSSCFDRGALEELAWHDTCHEHPDDNSVIDILDSGLRYESGLRAQSKSLYKDGSAKGTLAICRKWRYSA